MNYDLIISITSISWLWINITPIQSFLLVRNWGYITTILTCQKCFSLSVGFIICLVFYQNPINAIVASYLSYIIEKITNHYE